MIKGITSILLMFITFKMSIDYVPYFWALVAAFFVTIMFRAMWNGIFDPKPRHVCKCKGEK
jgi:hypothetical protein